ncbi:MAG: hypothetical protein L6R38_007128 [Xanthoria sp. 2 TBL-2021]|nr:MAG: hypothetical protein L6R38_007128 [Xanthoria sp. 2 TBL-2021]
MASLAKPAISSQCLGYLRRLAGIHSARLSPSFHQQVRGKKKNAKGPHVVNVRLLEDIQGYGRKGSIIPIAPGRMRNIYYPQRKAEYVTEAQMRTTNQKDLLAERDFSFGLPQTQPDPQPMEEIAIGVPTKLLTPKRTSEIIEAQVPSDIIFYRVPIATPEPEPAPSEPVGNSINAIGGEAPLRKALELEPSVTRIFGSVSTADIVESIKAVLWASEEGARVVLAPEDININEKESEDLGIEADRLKALGEYTIEIRVKGVDPLPRRVVIRAQEADR